MGVVITKRHVQLARAAGACSSGLKAVRVGAEVSSLSADLLAWVGDCRVIPQPEIDAIASELCGQAVVGIHPELLGHSGYGSGYGYGYGDGDGSGSGDGYGYGDGYGGAAS